MFNRLPARVLGRILTPKGCQRYTTVVSSQLVRLGTSNNIFQNFNKSFSTAETTTTTATVNVSESAKSVESDNIPILPTKPEYIDFTKGNVYQTLQSRGFISASTSEAEQHITSGSRAVYAGFDPTSDNLHLGNLLVILVLMYFQKFGHQVVVLVGGATGLIGDPSGRSSERTLLDENTVKKNVLGIQNTLQQFLISTDIDTKTENDAETKAAPITNLIPTSEFEKSPIYVNNYDWYSSMSVVSYLRDVGKFFRMGSMLSKDSVRKRMSSEDGGDADGMSFTEFSYQTLQGYDFYKLYEKYGCSIQFGGSDQWGNITAGIDYINRYITATKEQQTPVNKTKDTSEKDGGQEKDTAGLAHGFTIPLLTTSSGAKFGKSAGNALFLNPAKTSPYQMYQYLLQTTDVDVKKLLTILTFFSTDYIDIVTSIHTNAPEKRTAQRILAEEVVRMIHGDTGVRKALEAAHILFPSKAPLPITLPDFDLQNQSQNVSLSAEELVMALDGVPKKVASPSEVIGAEIVDIAVLIGLASSRGEARRLVKAGGLYVNNIRVTDPEEKIEADKHVLLNDIVIIRSGQKKQFFIHMQ